MISTPRTSGVLLPLFSLRRTGDFGIGDFGAAPAFFRWLKAAKQKLWMMLPLLPTAPGDSSPYSTRSAFGLNPLFIDLDEVPEFGEAGGRATLSPDERQKLEQAQASSAIRYDWVFPLKASALRRAFDFFFQAHWEKKSARAQALSNYLREQSEWLDDFSLYTALSMEQQQRGWWEWPEGVKDRQPSALEEARWRLRREVLFQSWLQFVAEEQWQKVRASARQHEVLLCGDEPFIVGQDSADCWSHPHLLRRDARLGVPPDAFSATGQDWGLPYFDFEAISREQNRWLLRRAQKSAAYYDLRRVDHAVGYFRQWIRDEKTPTGRFVPPDETLHRALGERLFRLLLEPGAGIFAEDLGVVPSFAREILTQLGIPGYRVLRWERDEGQYRDPRRYPDLSVATTGTHDTETLRQWWENAQPWEREATSRVYQELQGLESGPPFTPEIHRALLAAAENSGSRFCVLPWQDILGSKDRINLPGTIGASNWSYRIHLQVEDLLLNDATKSAAERLAQLTEAGKR